MFLGKPTSEPSRCHGQIVNEQHPHRFCWGQPDLLFQLCILKHDYAKGYSEKKHLGFTVVNPDKAKDYPLNFVCNLPLRLTSNETKLTTFERLFGDKSFEVARKLLIDALKTEEDEEIKSEIERRLKMLEPETVVKIKCSGCGKLFHPRRVRKHQANFCEECVKKKFGSRE
jgi:hypothetical protein